MRVYGVLLRDETAFFVHILIDDKFDEEPFVLEVMLILIEDTPFL